MKGNSYQLLNIAVLVLLLGLWRLLQAADVPKTSVHHPDWSKNQSIYEVNLRQYTPSGTFKDFESHLPRLKEMGVGILWFMPVHPIGEKNRKGSLGSYYSVRDYYAVNPEFGTMDDFKAMVKHCHEQGFHVIIDWVINHTAWDNPLCKEHPEWFTKDSTGSFVSPVPDWHDVMDLNYNNRELWTYMIGVMKFWVEKAGVDGFRCDVSGMVPIEFWNAARAELDKIKPVFMLAEDENPICHEQAYDMSYGWELLKIMNGIAEGKKTAEDVSVYLEKNAKNYPADAYRMYFTSNHDENTWSGTEFDRLKDGAKAFAVLAFTLPGMPLIYSGQEIGLNKRLRFFDKDTIVWTASEYESFYRTLVDLKKRNPALWNGLHGGEISTVHVFDGNCLVYSRTKEHNRVTIVLNLSGKDQKVTLKNDLFLGEYRDVFSKKAVKIQPNETIMLKPWEFRVLE